MYLSIYIFQKRRKRCSLGRHNLEGERHIEGINAYSDILLDRNLNRTTTCIGATVWRNMFASQNGISARSGRRGALAGRTTPHRVAPCAGCCTKDTPCTKGVCQACGGQKRTWPSCSSNSPSTLRGASCSSVYSQCRRPCIVREQRAISRSDFPLVRWERRAIINSPSNHITYTLLIELYN